LKNKELNGGGGGNRTHALTLIYSIDYKYYLWRQMEDTPFDTPIRLAMVVRQIKFQ
jgi:hypothetical protein